MVILGAYGHVGAWESNFNLKLMSDYFKFLSALKQKTEEPLGGLNDQF